MTNLSKNLSQNPFETIRREDEQGEHWMARDLMPILGYPRWSDFKDAIDRAKLSCENAGNAVPEHFSGLFLKNPSSSQGRKYQDYKLSRYACYLIAMNGDPRKTEISQAQAYFTIKIREAETVIPAQEDRLLEQKLRIKELELQLALTRESRYIMERREAIILMNPDHRAAFILGAQVIEPPPEIVEKTVVVDPSGRQLANFDGVGIGYIVKRYGFRNNKEAWGWLESIGYGKSDKWIQELTAIQSAKLPREELTKLDALFQSRKGNRQMLLGE